MLQLAEHGQHRGGLERGAVVAVQHGFGVHRRDAFGQRGTPHQMHGMHTVVALVHLGAHDLAAVQIQDQVQVEPPAHHLGRQVGHVPAQHLPWGRGDVRGVVGARVALGALARPRRVFCPAILSTRAMLDSLPRYTPSSASIGTMRAGGTEAKRGSLATASNAARSAALRAWQAGHRAHGATACHRQP